MKAIIKPSLLKISLAFVLLVLSSFLWRAYVISTISDTFPWGFPLQFYMAWGPCPPGEICSESSVFFLILDLVFWYLISGLLISRIKTSQPER
jgi:hypothetical protein